ncbi:ABC transporter permease [Nonomuraea sp. NBC_01738]|uniref:ABC transporter permease n=1 Tax=Nonomuraea sp. NBC_01738 TaxID=2976003 RepID=UPI002E103DE0|nr:ABC transporter permease [Nonomuraea sp. NBC_01738]
MSLTATYKLGARLFWRDKGMLAGSVITPVALAVGMPVLMANVRADGATAAADIFYGTIALLLSITSFMNIAVALTMRRDQLLLKRLRSTRLTDAQILAGEVASTVTQTVGLLAGCLVAVHFLAGVPYPEHPLLFGLAAVAGSLTVAVLGVAYTAAIPRGELAAAMTVPVFLVCGVSAGAMGPMLELLPSWVGTVLGLLPTSAVVDAMRTGPDALLPLVVNLLVWGVVGLAAIKLWLRWEPRRS